MSWNINVSLVMYIYLMLFPVQVFFLKLAILALKAYTGKAKIKILGSESFARWLVSLVLELVLVLEIELALVVELALGARDN